MRPTRVMREWSTRRLVTAAAAWQLLWLGVMIAALALWDLPLSVPVAVALWAGPAVTGVLGTWMVARSSGE
ncbi:hypothetical protein [Streptomyces sp. CC208A]|uniref:hypothetical protein n=1 Tax=Streptomyces sp. CC208A TaxID=3044573 RepID=UPI0024A9D5B4|nr:hypothetical protein [Streptomyces sp. CC208A]